MKLLILAFLAGLAIEAVLVWGVLVADWLPAAST